MAASSSTVTAARAALIARSIPPGPPLHPGRSRFPVPGPSLDPAHDSAEVVTGGEDGGEGGDAGGGREVGQHDPVPGDRRANSGHPGLPMGCAPMGYDEVMRYNPKNPYWFNRDRVRALSWARLHAPVRAAPLGRLRQRQGGGPQVLPAMGKQNTWAPREFRDARLRSHDRFAS